VQQSCVRTLVATHVLKCATACIPHSTSASPCASHPLRPPAQILRLLKESQGNILDDEQLINVLNHSKLTSSVITVRARLGAWHGGE